MSLVFNPSEKRYDIQGLAEDTQKKGIKGYTGLEGRIRAFFSNAIAIKLDSNKTVYLNRESSRNFYDRIVVKYPELKNDTIKWNKDKDVKSFIQNCCNYVRQQQTDASSLRNKGLLGTEELYESEERSSLENDSAIKNGSIVEESDHPENRSSSNYETAEVESDPSESVSSSHSRTTVEKQSLEESDSTESASSVVNEPVGENKVPLKDISRDIYANRDKIFRESGKDIDKAKKEIESRLEDKGFSLDQLVKDPEALEIFMSSTVLRMVLMKFTDETGDIELKEKHLDSIVKSVRENLNDYTQIALLASVKDDKIDEKMVMLNLTLLIMKQFKVEGRSLQEIIDNPQMKAVFMQSGRLKLVLEIYEQLKDAPKIKAAKDQARFDAERDVGLLTQFALKDVPENQLRGKVRRLLADNHADRGGDRGKYDQLIKLRDMIDDGQLQVYKDALAGYRQRFNK